MRLRGSNPRRIRLTAGGWPDRNPPREKATMPRATYFDGVAVKDPALAALLRSAEAQGFRLEEATNGGHQRQTGLVAYPPDPEQSPVRFGTAEVHPKHIANIRANLRRAGFIDPDGDLRDAAQQATATTTPTEENPVSRSSKQSGVRPSSNGSDAPTVLVDSILAQPNDFPRVALNDGDRYVEAMRKAHDALRSGGVSEAVITLTTILTGAALTWDRDHGKIRDEVTQEAVDEALALAAEAEARALRAEAAADKAQEREIAAREDCKAALERAKQAEARAEALDAALRPLRAILQTGGAA